MSSLTGLRFLRPYLQQDLPVVRHAAYLRFFSTTRSCLSSKQKKAQDEPGIKRNKVAIKSDVQGRIEELQKAMRLEWPMITNSPHAMTLLDYTLKYHDMNPSELKKSDYVMLRGRVLSCRVASSALVFLDIVQDGTTVQIVADLSRIDFIGGENKRSFKAFYRLIRRGDIISVYGHPYVTQRGELSLNAIEIPQILSPSLASLPRTLEDRETRVRNRHVDMLVNSSVVETLRLRSHIIQSMRDFLLKDNFMEVQTPLIADKAGGAIAKPFTTVATEFSDKQLALRIAPEIWLKRLVIGGMDRVFEIGPAFRNEGLDATHNPEFTTCEFYRAFTDLEELMRMTESMLSSIATRVSELRKKTLVNLPAGPPLEDFTKPFQRLEFIPTIEAVLGTSLPDLSSPTAEADLTALFEKHSLPLPLSPTLPRLLDKLSSLYIEPSCSTPTFITHHPSCMAPLSKSFLCPKTSQSISARAELFIGHREIANMYEEENSPLQQREKFVQQLKWKDDENRAGVDESYIEALEYGLPPTGGWGAGIDRIVMMFGGAKRISDVLAFGSLRNVVNLGREGTAAVDGVVEGIECRGKGPVEERREGKLRRKESENIRREKVKAEVRRARERDIVVMMRKAKELGLGDVVRGLDSELKLQEEKVEDPIGEEEVEHVDKEEVGGGKKAGDV
ncbi:hypothetical protein IFR04_015230 [Cadophora malorum]|uniref:Lysyl-tRNA synthetase n=1 Tax=Cadophora malorum TaxID=108018 RepID=A0A8H7T267_9HELO|nr:hypothetical protein IFR04_015230 [Cadophora malorum]